MSSTVVSINKQHPRRRHPTTSAADTFVPEPDYDRNPAIGERTCHDCQATPGEPCHWACSSWWS